MTAHSIGSGSTKPTTLEILVTAPRAHFGALDAMRGPAALCIAIFHFDDQWAGYLAVEFFFVLSGFLLAHGMLARPQQVPIGLYVARRIIRLYPMHVYCLITYGLASWVIVGSLPSYPDGTLATMLQQLSLTHGVGFNTHGLTWNYPAWAISVEFWVGLVAFFLLARGVTTPALLLISLTSLGLILWHNGSLATNYQNYFGFVNSGLLRGLGSVLLGVVAYRLYCLFAVFALSRARFTWLELACVVAAVLMVASRSGVVSPFDLLAPFVFMASTIVFACEGGVISELMCKFSGLGTISYSMYLNQATVLLCLHPVWEILDVPMIVGLSVYLVLLVAYSYATHRLIERPARQRGLAVVNRLRRNG